MFSAPAPVAELAFLPDQTAPWTGLIAAGLTSGGFDFFDVDGQRAFSTSGPRLRGLVGVPDFPLRGEAIPLVFGLDDEGALRGFAVVRQVSDVIELPVSGFDAPARGLCFFGSGIGFFDLAVLGQSSTATILRVSDTGDDGLTVREQEEIDLPFPAFDCAGFNGDLLISGPNAGVARITPQGEVSARHNSLSIFDIAYSELLGRPVALAVSNETGLVTAFDAETLIPITELRTISGLSTAGFVTPMTLAVTEANYGGMAYASGLVAVYDRADESVKLVAREVVARVVVSPTG